MTANSLYKEDVKHVVSIPQGATVAGRAGCATGGRVDARARCASGRAVGDVRSVVDARARFRV